MDAKTLEKKLKFIEDYKKASNAATGSKVDSNANVTQKNIATLATELGKMDNILLQRAVLQNYITKDYSKELAEQYIKDLDNHIIYRHDETGGSGGFPYCVAISLYPFLIDGLKTLDGNSEPPKHANSYIGGISNLIFLIAGQYSGAIAIPEFLTYFDHFLRIDYGQDYISHLDDCIEIWGNRQLTLRKKIEDWFQQLIYTINAPASARGYQSCFTNIAYFDRYYFEHLFDDFFFPDGDLPCWETTKELQKMFMRWFNKERTRALLTFPVESFSLLVDKETGKYLDEESADFVAEMHSLGHSFFIYQSDSADSLSSCCRLRNSLEDNSKVFSTSMGSSAIKTGSKAVITLNLNRITQDWYRVKDTITLNNYIENITDRVHKYLSSYNHKLWDDFDAGILTVYKAGYIDLDSQFLTVGINGVVESAEFLSMKNDTKYNGIKVDYRNSMYKEFVKDTLGTIENLNKKHKTEHTKFNLECVPGENMSGKEYNWDKEDGYWVPENRVLYNSYFYVVEDETVDPIQKLYYQGYGFADICSGGVAAHINLSENLTKSQYRMLMNVAVKAGCNYFTYNVPQSCCDNPLCGHIEKRPVDKCPKCGSTVTPATRIIGYLRKVSNFSEIRQKEFKQRAFNTIKKNN